MCIVHPIFCFENHINAQYKALFDLAAADDPLQGLAIGTVYIVDEGSLGNVQEVGLQPAQQEQRRITSEFGPDISLEALNHMEVLQRNITEALRINPPLTLLLRQVKKSFAVTTSSGKTHIVPKVSISLASVIRGGSAHQDRSWSPAPALHLVHLCVKDAYSVTHTSASVLLTISAILQRCIHQSWAFSMTCRRSCIG